MPDVFNILDGNPITNPRQVWFVDDFRTFLDTSFVGEMNFQIGGTGTEIISTVTPVAGDIGVVNLSTGGVAANSVYIFQAAGGPFPGSPSAPLMLASQMAYMGWLVLIPTITSLTAMVGLGQNISTPTTFGTNGVFFRFDPATSANWQFITRSASVSTTITTTQAVAAGTWYWLEAYNDGVSWTPVVNFVANAPSTTNLPVTPVNLGAHVTTNVGATRSMSIDRFQGWSTDLGTRL